MFFNRLFLMFTISMTAYRHSPILMNSTKTLYHTVHSTIDRYIINYYNAELINTSYDESNKNAEDDDIKCIECSDTFNDPEATQSLINQSGVTHTRLEELRRMLRLLRFTEYKKDFTISINDPTRKFNSIRCFEFMLNGFLNKSVAEIRPFNMRFALLNIKKDYIRLKCDNIQELIINHVDFLRELATSEEVFLKNLKINNPYPNKENNGEYDDDDEDQHAMVDGEIINEYLDVIVNLNEIGEEYETSFFSEFPKKVADQQSRRIEYTRMFRSSNVFEQSVILKCVNFSRYECQKDKYSQNDDSSRGLCGCDDSFIIPDIDKIWINARAVYIPTFEQRNLDYEFNLLFNEKLTKKINNDNSNQFQEHNKIYEIYEKILIQKIYEFKQNIEELPISDGIPDANEYPISAFSFESDKHTIVSIVISHDSLNVYLDKTSFDFNFLNKTKILDLSLYRALSVNDNCNTHLVCADTVQSYYNTAIDMHEREKMTEKNLEKNLD